MVEVKTLRNRVEKLKGERDLLKKQIKEEKKLLRSLRVDRDNAEKAREFIRMVGLKTQQQLQYHISDITSLALSAVFDNPYELKVDFVQRRNKTECDLLFVRDGLEIDPLDSSGYGAVDVASFALRVVSWSMQQPRARNVIILDEPMRFLSEDRQEYASKMIKELSEKLKLQFIIVTHKDKLSMYADKIFQVTLKDGFSAIQTKNNND